jgi:hypothetical protein
MRCKCGTPIPAARAELGYKCCTRCSTEARWSGVPVIHHKTGNEIEIVKDPEVAADFFAKSARVGFGTLRGLRGSGPKRAPSSTGPRALPPKPVPPSREVRTPLPNEWEAVGLECMALLEKAGAQAALAHVERSLLERRIFRVHADRLKAIIEELGVL